MSDPDDNLKGNAVPEVVAEAKAKVIQPIHGAHAGSDGPAAVMNDESGGTREKTGEPADSFASAGKPSLAETHANDGSSALRGNRHETPDRIEAEMKRLGEERASLGMEAWAGQSEALKNPRGLRAMTLTLLAPRRSEVRQQSIAVLPTPMISTRSSMEVMCPKATPWSQSMPMKILSLS